MAVGAVAQHDHVVITNFGKPNARVYGTFDAWFSAYRFRQNLPKAQREGARVLPIHGIG